MITNEFIQKSAEATREAYAKIVKEEVSLGEVKVSTTSFKDFLQGFSQQSERTVVLVYFILYRLESESKEIAGNALVIFDPVRGRSSKDDRRVSEGDSASNGVDGSDNTPLDERERSRLAEVGNMLIGAYLGSLSNLSDANLRASIQPIFKSTITQAAGLLENQLFRGDKEEEFSLVEIQLTNKGRVSLYVFLK